MGKIALPTQEAGQFILDAIWSEEQYFQTAKNFGSRAIFQCEQKKIVILGFLYV